ncbi:hypothetical protein E8E15_007029 [Penicillium rubens]|uniref:uncharacterized protein n=1 Tax=Penicillium rubens TaxID=1108849 RepID=UPI001DB31341|nr:uncharacterized protein N7525_004114 [Penicillium rubens]KAF3018024.1 hypothetical protein E8E15_007029 [Penicillium rubens]KAJ5838926.1 hypothetical protein N7525_004114 [Penicillium rubens]
MAGDEAFFGTGPGVASLYKGRDIYDSYSAGAIPYRPKYVATGYPEQHKRGRYIATWFAFRNFGNIIGGAVSLGINHSVNQRGQVGYQTYLAFIAIQCLGLVIGPLLSNPEKVQRDDGTRIEAPRGIHWREELRTMWRLARSRSILLLVPLFWYFGWIQAYPGTYLATYLTVRARALGSFMSAVVGTLATWMGGTLVDLPWLKDRKHRAIITFIVIALLNNWGDQRSFGRGFGLYLFERRNLSDSPGDQIRYSSLLRGIETAAVAVGFDVQAVPTALIATASINLSLWFIALPFSYYATLQVVRKFELLEKGRHDRDGSDRVAEQDVTGR